MYRLKTIQLFSNNRADYGGGAITAIMNCHISFKDNSAITVLLIMMELYILLVIGMPPTCHLKIIQL